MLTFLHRFTLSTLAITCLSPVFAATPIDLQHQPVSYLQTWLPRINASSSVETIKSLQARVDFNQTTHLRIKQFFADYPVWGSDAVIHIPKNNPASLSALAANQEPNNITMNGIMYKDINEDINNTPAYIFNAAQKEKALAHTINSYQNAQTNKTSISQSKALLMVYIDKNNKAHWAYLISFFAQAHHAPAALPTYIIDAASFIVYEQWNDLKRLQKEQLVEIKGGGIGGNEGPIGKISYDGLPGHFPALQMQRNSINQVCSLKNKLTIIADRRLNDQTVTFKCKQPDSKHNNLYWNTTDDMNNGGYSPNNDALYSDSIVRQMYKAWFNIDMLVKNGKPMQVTMKVHDPDEGQNAYYSHGEMVFGDGDNESYPITAPSVVAHEMSHGFTEQHSDLVYENQSGGLNESFSDMADKAVEYYVKGENNWEIDPEVLKPGGRLLRWMDTPTKDCGKRKPGDYCSIDHMKDYGKTTEVHFTSGIFNKAFTLIAAKWNTKKAFEVMTKANMDYWTPNTTFDAAACGVIAAAKDYKYDTAAVFAAMKTVGVDTTNCTR